MVRSASTELCRPHAMFGERRSTLRKAAAYLDKFAERHNIIGGMWFEQWAEAVYAQ
jgi:hypothetical protein